MKINLKKLIEQYMEDPEAILVAIQDWQQSQNCAPTHVSMREFIPLVVDLYTQLLAEQTKEKTDPEKELKKLRSWKLSMMDLLRKIEDGKGNSKEIKNWAKHLRWKQEIG